MKRIVRCAGLLVAGLVLVEVLGLGAGAAAVSSAPYNDPNAIGSIGLCDQNGHQITSGSVTTTPFAWRAVSTEPAAAPYNNAGRTATLVVYQPMQGLPPGDWSGAQLTSSSRYTNPASPMAAATDRDQSLEDIIEQYHPKWDGFLQLRLYLGTANEPTYTLHYPTLNIQVTGDTWQAVGGAPVNCASGTSESVESILLQPSTTSSTESPVKTSSNASSSGAEAPSGTEAHQDASGTDPNANGGGERSSALGSSTPAATVSAGTSDAPLVLGLTLGLLLVLAIAVALLLQRRRLAGHPAEPGSSSLSSPTRSLANHESTKGDTP